MISRITSAYTHFSKLKKKHPIPGTHDTAVKRQNGKQEKPVSQQEVAFRIQDKQISQLRETGTLDNLQTILNESEKALLQRLFPDRPQRYAQDGELINAPESSHSNKGCSLDKTL